MVDQPGAASEEAKQTRRWTAMPRTVRRNPAFRRVADPSYDPSGELRRCPVGVLSVDLPEMEIHGTIPTGARRARVLVREGKNVIGTVEVPVRSGRVDRRDLAAAIDSELSYPLVTSRFRELLEQPSPSTGWTTADVVSVDVPSAFPVAAGNADRPTVTAVVCTRDRPDDLYGALTALTSIPGLDEIVVIDNAPTTQQTRSVVNRFDGVRYEVEPIPGLDRARNRGLKVATSEIVAFTDDDATVDHHWARALADVFAADEAIGAVTGLVLPLELETQAQLWFEQQGGFGRGYTRRWYHTDLTDVGESGARFLGAGDFGTGANMAFRRQRLLDIGGFDPALDVGTPTGGGGDLNAMFETVHHGSILVYEPRMVVRHRHRRTTAELDRQLRANASVFAHVESSATLDPSLRPGAWSIRWWAARFYAQRLMRSLAIPGELPPSIVLGEMSEALRAVGGRTYRESVAAGRRVGDEPFERPDPPRRSAPLPTRIAIREVDLGGPIEKLDDLEGYRTTRIRVNLSGFHIGRIEIVNGGRSISRARLLDELAAQLGVRLLVGSPIRQMEERWPECRVGVRQTLGLVPEHDTPLEPSDVSVVISTLDRPDDLRRCLEAVSRQVTDHRLEVLVVDNNPASGLTGPVVAQFRNVTLVEERCRGLSYARNAGVRAARGEIIAFTDDDVIVPEDWVDRVVHHFARDDVMAVCGNILPVELEQRSQIVFEDLEYLGKGDDSREVGTEWFRKSVRRTAETWELGAGANLAVRREVFDDPAVGMYDHALGPGSPSGLGEDSYHLYRVVRAGHTVVFEPGCWVLHRHRATDDALEYQVRTYFRGAVAHQLATVERDGELRAFVHLIRLVRWQLRGLVASHVRRRPSRRAFRAQTAGLIEGPRGYLAARRRATQLDRESSGSGADR